MLTAAGIVLVLSCQAHRKTRQQAVLDTWGQSLPAGWRLLIVEGGEQQEPGIDGRYLHVSVPDDYNHLAEKTFRALEFLCRHARFQGILKCDDDTYLHMQRFVDGFDREIPYAGNSADTMKGCESYAQGGAYWLSSTACDQLVSSAFESYEHEDWFLGRTPMRKRGEKHARQQVSIEDLMVGEILRQKGIPLHQDDRFNPDPFPSVYEQDNLFTCHHVRPFTMRLVHRQGRWNAHPLKRWFIPWIKFLPTSRKPR